MTTTPTHGASVEFRGVVHVYRAAGTDIAALRGIDLTVTPGQHLALLGPSGSGKSTLLTLLAGIRQPSAGEIRVDNIDIARFDERQVRRYRATTVGTMLQGARPNLLGYATIDENIAYARMSRPRRQRATAGADALLDATHTASTLRTVPVSRLTPSQQQIAAVAVAMANQPRLLIADEPTSRLDAAARDEVLDAMLSLAARTGATVIVVTHDPAVAHRMQRVVHLNGGRVGAEDVNAERFAVFGADRSVPVPAHIAREWQAGDRLRVTDIGPDEIRITREVDS